MIPSLKDKFPNTEILATRLAHLQDFQKSNDADYNVTSYSSLSQSYHNTGAMNVDDSKEDEDDNQSVTQSVNSNAPSPQLSNYSATPQASNASQSPYV